MKIAFHTGAAYLREDGTIVTCLKVYDDGSAVVRVPTNTTQEISHCYNADGRCTSCVKELGAAFQIIGPAHETEFNPHTVTASQITPEDLKPSERKMYDALGSDLQKKVFLERQGTYGSVVMSHQQIGRMWAAKLTNYLGVQVDDLPGYIVALMMVDMKTQRASRVYHNDNYVDAHNYLEFANTMQEAGE